MHPSEFERTARTLARPCVYLRDRGAAYCAVWGGPSVAEAPPGPFRHWLSVDAATVPGAPVGPGVLSIFTNEDDGVSGAVVVDHAARLPVTPSGVALHACPGVSLPPVDAVFSQGGESITAWLRSVGWDPEWPYNDNFRDRDVLEAYEQVYQESCPLYTGDSHAVLGGWHFPWPDGDWPQLVRATLLAWTFAESEPWVEAWSDGSRRWVSQRIS